MRAMTRGRIRPDLIYLGWHKPDADPGPPPTPPESVELAEIGADWLRALKAEHARLVGPARRRCAVGAAAVAVCPVPWLLGFLPGEVSITGAVVATFVVAQSVADMRRAARIASVKLRNERERIEQVRALQREKIAAAQAEHARQYRDWQRRCAAAWRQPQWCPVVVAAEDCDRIDVAGGTPAGWSALLTTLVTPRLLSGGTVTVVDLTESGVAHDLLDVDAGVDPLALVLPRDLPRLRIGPELSREVFADVLARTALSDASSASPTSTTAAQTVALLSDILEAVGPRMPTVLAALRAVARAGGPDSHFAELTPQQLDRLAGLGGRGAERPMIDLARAVEAKLRVLSALGTARSDRTSKLRLVWLAHHAATLANRTLAAYLVIALTAGMRQGPAGGTSWQHTTCLLGAERVSQDILDDLRTAAETSRTGLVLCYRSIPSHVRDRLGAGACAVAFMRLGNAQDARYAAEQIGSQHRLTLSQLTHAVGSSVTATAGESFSVSLAGSMSLSRSSSLGRSRGGRPIVPVAGGEASKSTADSASLSVTDSRTASWSGSTSQSAADSSTLTRTVQRSREFLVEQHELQELPPSAVLVCQPGRQPVLADTNPAIMALPTATLAIKLSQLCDETI